MRAEEPSYDYANTGDRVVLSVQGQSVRGMVINSRPSSGRADVCVDVEDIARVPGLCNAARVARDMRLRDCEPVPMDSREIFMALEDAGYDVIVNGDDPEAHVQARLPGGGFAGVAPHPRVGNAHVTEYDKDGERTNNVFSRANTYSLPQLVDAVGHMGTADEPDSPDGSPINPNMSP